MKLKQEGYLKHKQIRLDFVVGPRAEKRKFVWCTDTHFEFFVQTRLFFSGSISYTRFNLRQSAKSADQTVDVRPLMVEWIQKRRSDDV